MNEIKGMSRRNFLAGAAMAGIAAAGAGLGGCAPKTAEEGEESPSPAKSSDKKHTWEQAPDPITDIVKDVDTEVLVIGGGYSGTCCAPVAYTHLTLPTTSRV